MTRNRNSKKLCFVFGTRPEIIKMAPVIKECQRRGIAFVLIHTGQHYSGNMDAVFLRNLELPPIDYNLRVGSGSHAGQTARMLTAIESIFDLEHPAVVIVQGDTNSTLAGALAAAKLNIAVAHIEGGLRSFDRSMPEEINRILADAVTLLNFAPTERARENLRSEGVADSKIHVTGNTVVDALYQNRGSAEQKSTIHRDLSLVAETRYALITVHRAENTDSKERLANILSGLKSVAETHGLKIVWPMHPRTKKLIERLNLEAQLYSIENLSITEPVNFFDMLWLQSNANVVITDSGGLQEESCILRVPCVTVRYNTERPESVAVGANQLAGVRPADILRSVTEMLGRKRTWENPFGDGTSGARITDALQDFIERHTEPQRDTVDLVLQPETLEAQSPKSQS